MFQNILTNHGPLNSHYLQRIEDTLKGALLIHPRLTVIRVDLRLPDNGSYSTNPLERDTPTSFANTDTDLVKRFIASIKAQIKAEQNSKIKTGMRVHPCELHYVWVKEYSDNHKSHYHVALMFNKDRYHLLGDYRSTDSLAGMIIKAWASALKLHPGDCGSLVHFPENPTYYLNDNASHEAFRDQFNPVFMRLSYFAKERTKVYGNGQRSFGCSHPQKNKVASF